MKNTDFSLGLLSCQIKTPSAFHRSTPISLSASFLAPFIDRHRFHLLAFIYRHRLKPNMPPFLSDRFHPELVIFVFGKVLQAAFWYGLVVHFRIYPIIYALPIILVLDPHNFRSGSKPALQNWSLDQHKFHQSASSMRLFSMSGLWLLLKSVLSRERILFGLFSGLCFFLWTGLSFYLYGWEFLHEALLYHLTRTDPRHNFSIYFYHIYLHHQHEFSVLEKLVSFLPQLTVQLVLIFRFALDLPFCLFAQTVAFVAFNKVITAQYFVWFFCLLPLILPWSNMKFRWEGLCCILVWMGAQIHWLMWGYLLEFKGKNVFVPLWFAGLLFLVANTWVLIMVIRRHRFSPLFIWSGDTKTNICSERKFK